MFPGWYPFWRNHTKKNIYNTKYETDSNKKEKSFDQMYHVHFKEGYLPLITLFEKGHSHLTLTACEERECKSLSHLSKVAEASGVDSAGIGQGTQQVIGQIAATFL